MQENAHESSDREINGKTEAVINGGGRVLFLAVPILLPAGPISKRGKTEESIVCKCCSYLYTDIFVVLKE